MKFMKHNIIKVMLLGLLVVGGYAVASAQPKMKKPILMVVPSESLCIERGYKQEIMKDGRQLWEADFERALTEDQELTQVITKIGALMTERGFTLKDMLQTLRDMERSEEEDDAVRNGNGRGLAETSLERASRRARCDMMVEVSWIEEKTGPKRLVSYSMRGLDSYTNKQVAGAQGAGAPSVSAPVTVLVEEAVLQNIDNFLGQLQGHFDDIIENGREVALNLRIFNGSGINFTKQYSGEELTDAIEAWMEENTVGGRFNMVDAGDTRLAFEQVRIPYARANGRPMETRHFAGELRKFLAGSPYNISCKLVTKGLGRVDVVLGQSDGPDDFEAAGMHKAAPERRNRGAEGTRTR